MGSQAFTASSQLGMGSTLTVRGQHQPEIESCQELPDKTQRFPVPFEFQINNKLFLVQVYPKDYLRHTYPKKLTNCFSEIKT